MDKYELEALRFLDKTKTEFTQKFLRNDFHFKSDDRKRDIYEITLARGERKFVFNFGQSINASGKWVIYGATGKFVTNDEIIKKKYRLGEFSINKDFKEPTAYDVLSVLSKHDPDTFDAFCEDYGYSKDSIAAKQTYEAVKEEYEKLCMLFNDEEMEQLREIQ